jgi:hypothetical protein
MISAFNLPLNGNKSIPLVDLMGNIMGIIHNVVDNEVKELYVTWPQVLFKIYNPIFQG